MEEDSPERIEAEKNQKIKMDLQLSSREMNVGDCLKSAGGYALSCVGFSYISDDLFVGFRRNFEYELYEP